MEIVVTSAADTDGVICPGASCTLRGAIDLANVVPGPDRIVFAIGSGQQTIRPVATLPGVVDTVEFDGATQPGFAGEPLIYIDANSNGLIINAPDCTIRSLAFMSEFGGANAIIVNDGGAGTTIVGNRVGFAPDFSASGFGAAVFTQADRVQFGGPSPEEGNLIGNGGGFHTSAGSHENLIEGNRIGIAGALATFGVSVAGSGNTVRGNTIRAVQDGVLVQESLPGVRNRVSQNSIVSSSDLAIDLDPPGPTPNDPGDADLGANERQNYPVVTGVVRHRDGYSVRGLLASTAGEAFLVEVFASSVPGQAETFLGSDTVVTDASGNAIVSVVISDQTPPGSWITATATDAEGNTSELGSGVQLGAVVSVPVLNHVGLAILAFVLAAAAWRILKRRSASL